MRCCKFEWFGSDKTMFDPCTESFEIARCRCIIARQQGKALDLAVERGRTEIMKLLK